MPSDRDKDVGILKKNLMILLGIRRKLRIKDEELAIVILVLVVVGAMAGLIAEINHGGKGGKDRSVDCEGESEDDGCVDRNRGEIPAEMKTLAKMGFKMVVVEVTVKVTEHWGQGSRGEWEQ